MQFSYNCSSRSPRSICVRWPQETVFVNAPRKRVWIRAHTHVKLKSIHHHLDTYVCTGIRILQSTRRACDGSCELASKDRRMYGIRSTLENDLPFAERQRMKLLIPFSAPSPPLAHTHTHTRSHKWRTNDFFLSISCSSVRSLLSRRLWMKTL